MTYYEENKAKLLQYQKEYNEKHKERVKLLREQNKERYLQYQKEYRERVKEANKEKRKEQNKRYYEKRKARLLAEKN